MPLKNSVHPLCGLGRCSLVTAEAFQKQHFKTKCTVLSVTSFKLYQFYPNTHALKMEGSTLLSSIRNGVSRYFNAATCPKSWSMPLDLQPGASIESEIFSKTISFSTSVPSPPFKKLRSKVRFILLFETVSFWISVFKSDVEIQSRILHVVVDTKEYTAEVYTYAKQLLATLTLGEGRQRYEADKEPALEDSPVSKFLQDRQMRLEQDKKKAEQELENLRRQIQNATAMGYQPTPWRKMWSLFSSFISRDSTSRPYLAAWFLMFAALDR